MPKCLFCDTEGPFTTTEHVIPESLGNDDLVLEGEVCDACQGYFGKEVEQYVLSHTPIAFWRVWQRIPSKKGKLPVADFRQPVEAKGRWPDRHPIHDDVVFRCGDDGTHWVTVNDETLRSIQSGTKNTLTYVLTPKGLFMLGRFLCKIGVELLAAEGRNRAIAPELTRARRYARFGEFDGLWPIFYYRDEWPRAKTIAEHADGSFQEEVLCYDYAMFDILHEYLLLFLRVGCDTWGVILNEPFGSLSTIQTAFPGLGIEVIWYPRNALG